jgi:hypothetical protein
MEYSADQIINKTLIAAQPVAIRRAASDSAPVVYTVPVGQAVGVVYSFLLPSNNRNNLYWQFYDSAKRPYYAAHKQGMYQIKALQNQGAITVKEATEKAAPPATVQEFIGKNLRLVIFVAAGVVLLKSVLPQIIKK